MHSSNPETHTPPSIINSEEMSFNNTFILSAGCQWSIESTFIAQVGYEKLTCLGSTVRNSIDHPITAQAQHKCTHMAVSEEQIRKGLQRRNRRHKGGRERGKAWKEAGKEGRRKKGKNGGKRRKEGTQENYTILLTY